MIDRAEHAVRKAWAGLMCGSDNDSRTLARAALCAALDLTDDEVADLALAFDPAMELSHDPHSQGIARAQVRGIVEAIKQRVLGMRATRIATSAMSSSPASRCSRPTRISDGDTVLAALEPFAREEAHYLELVDTDEPFADAEPWEFRVTVGDIRRAARIYARLAAAPRARHVRARLADHRRARLSGAMVRGVEAIRDGICWLCGQKRGGGDYYDRASRRGGFRAPRT